MSWSRIELFPIELKVPSTGGGGQRTSTQIDAGRSYRGRRQMRPWHTIARLPARVSSADCGVAELTPANSREERGSSPSGEGEDGHGSRTVRRWVPRQETRKVPNAESLVSCCLDRRVDFVSQLRNGVLVFSPPSSLNILPHQIFIDMTSY
ncbi:unnamed protein product [Urochloa humidicola]